MLKIKVKILAIQAMIGNKTLVESREKRLNSLTFNITVKNISLLKNPLNGGSPAMEKLPIKATEKETGMKTISPPRRLMSRVPILKSRIPTIIYKAWLIVILECRESELTPNKLMIKPSWLIVEYASKAFKSVSLIAENAPQNKVINPTKLTV